MKKTLSSAMAIQVGFRGNRREAEKLILEVKAIARRLGVDLESEHVDVKADGKPSPRRKAHKSHSRRKA